MSLARKTNFVASDTACTAGPRLSRAIGARIVAIDYRAL
jgi:hypothetical protein